MEEKRRGGEKGSREGGVPSPHMDAGSGGVGVHSPTLIKRAGMWSASSSQGTLRK